MTLKIPISAEGPPDDKWLFDADDRKLHDNDTGFDDAVAEEIVRRVSLPPLRPMGAAARLISTINNSGGLIQFPDGSIAPYCDPDWLDLGDAYMAACTELGVEPQITKGTIA